MKDATKELAQSVHGAAASFKALDDVLRSTVQETGRVPRRKRRRSRQCRGPRARNYTRAIARESEAGKSATTSKLALIVTEGTATGAVDAAQRLNKARQRD